MEDFGREEEFVYDILSALTYPFAVSYFRVIIKRQTQWPELALLSPIRLFRHGHRHKPADHRSRRLKEE